MRCVSRHFPRTCILLLGSIFTAATPFLAAPGPAQVMAPDDGTALAAISALSLQARQALAQQDFNLAWNLAKQTEAACERHLKRRPLDAEPALPLALGTAYEVESHVLAQQEQRVEAIDLLRRALTRWQGTSIVARLHKNLNVLDLVGKPAPRLRATAWLTGTPVSLEQLRGRPVLLFFWAHWCPDCKLEAPVFAQLARDYGPRGLALIGPTKLYGYTPQEEHATPEVERQFIERVYNRFYQAIPGMAVPLGEHNFDIYGASTTPTIVLLDRKGVVRLFHPGVIPEEDLRAAIEPLLVAGRLSSR